MHSSCFPRFVPFGLYQISSPVAGSGVFRSLEDAADKVPSLARGSRLTRKKDKRLCPEAGEATINTFHHVAKQNGRDDEGEDDGSSRERSVREKKKRRGKEKRERESFLTSFCSPFATESKVSTLKETWVVSPIERHSTCTFASFLSTILFAEILSMSVKIQLLLVDEYLIEIPRYN